MSILELESVTSGYGNTTVIRDVSLSIEEGKITCIVGRNGVGKSTLLQTIMGLLPLQRGSVRYKGQPLTDLKTFEIAKAGIAYAPQELETSLFSNLTVHENLKVGLRRSFTTTAIGKVLDDFPRLKTRLGQQAGTLSGGEKKMLIVCRIMIRNPNVMLLDEITEGLQPLVVENIQNMLLKINKEKGTTIVIVEQNAKFAMQIAQSYAIMDRGKIVENDLVSEESLEKIEKRMLL